ncbi:hypothetical protein GGX14DRAFT_399877 [Mycena pura]|uniref:Uncharacterized protein n=1 Tax=Mycena pura TaxID=153505 RepID=A0AAD6YC91_9AGAR|nr:hypothetical protein GGX14DRAFT_399877 [Mycena pura]
MPAPLRRGRRALEPGTGVSGGEHSMGGRRDKWARGAGNTWQQMQQTRSTLRHAAGGQATSKGQWDSRREVGGTSGGRMWEAHSGRWDKLRKARRAVGCGKHVAGGRQRAAQRSGYSGSGDKFDRSTWNIILNRILNR